MGEVTLPGGKSVGAVLIDGVVHKRASPWTPTVHALLRHLEQAGFDGAPRPLGFDEQGREMLSYMPGDTIGGRPVWPEWAFADSILVQVGQWMRRVHDLTEGFLAPPGERWFASGPMAPGLIVGHQDAAQYNAVVEDGKLVGFFDWGTAGPSTREFDLAYSALFWVPLLVPRTEESPANRSRRLHLFLDSYGYEGDRPAFGAAIVHRARRQAEVMHQMADAGDAAAIALVPIADLLGQSASYVEALPGDFWQR